MKDKFMGGHCHVYISPYTRTRQTWKSVKDVLLAGGGIDMTEATPEMVDRQLNEEDEEEEEAMRVMDEKLAESTKDVTAKEKKRMESLLPVMEAAAKRKTKKGKRVSIAHNQFEDDLIEQNYGNLAGVATISDAESDKKKFGRYFYRYPNGERVADVVKRTDNFMKRIRAEWEENQSVLLVTHGVTFRAILLNLCTDIPGETNVEKFEYFRNPGNCTTVAFKWPKNSFLLEEAEWHQEQDAEPKKMASGKGGGIENKKSIKEESESESSYSGSDIEYESESEPESKKKQEKKSAPKKKKKKKKETTTTKGKESESESSGSEYDDSDDSDDSL
jgi:broad specificity phosphatase PhoE